MLTRSIIPALTLGCAFAIFVPFELSISGSGFSAFAGDGESMERFGVPATGFGYHDAKRSKGIRRHDTKRSRDTRKCSEAEKKAEYYRRELAKLKQPLHEARVALAELQVEYDEYHAAYLRAKNARPRDKAKTEALRRAKNRIKRNMRGPKRVWEAREKRWRVLNDALQRALKTCPM